MTRFFGISLLMAISFIAIGCGTTYESNCSGLIKVINAKSPYGKISEQGQKVLTNFCNQYMAPDCTSSDFQTLNNFLLENGKPGQSIPSSFSAKCREAALQFVKEVVKSEGGAASP